MCGCAGWGGGWFGQTGQEREEAGGERGAQEGGRVSEVLDPWRNKGGVGSCQHLQQVGGVWPNKGGGGGEAVRGGLREGAEDSLFLYHPVPCSCKERPSPVYPSCAQPPRPLSSCSSITT